MSPFLRCETLIQPLAQLLMNQLKIRRFISAIGQVRTNGRALCARASERRPWRKSRSRPMWRAGSTTRINALFKVLSRRPDLSQDQYFRICPMRPEGRRFVR